MSLGKTQKIDGPVLEKAVRRFHQRGFFLWLCSLVIAVNEFHLEKLQEAALSPLQLDPIVSRDLQSTTRVA